MTEDLLSRSASVDYEDYGSLRVETVEQRDNDLLVSLVVTADEDPDLPQNVRITCQSWRENTLVPGHYADVMLTRDHVLLWHYHQPHVLVSFNGHVPDPLAVVGALFERHTELVGNLIPFSKYFNPGMRLSELIRGSFGMLADGPERLVLAYEEVMSHYGVSVSHHRSVSAYDEALSILMMDENYVIANGFVAEAI